MLLGITMGDSSGVGPEIALKAWAESAVEERIVLFGDLSALEHYRRLLKVQIDLHPVDSPGAAVAGRFNVLDLKLLQPGAIAAGRMSKESGYAALKYVERGTRAALDGEIDALVTLPVNKEATRLSTPDFTGHTELIAVMCGCAEYSMMLASDKLLVTHVSTHVSMRVAVDLVKKERVASVIRLTHRAADGLGRAPLIAVMGLNPHAGEHRAFGDEGELEIAPAVKLVRAEGINAVGPLPPDTVFMKAVDGAYGAVVCMYHDQGHIPMKMVGFHDTVNITIGLPVVRTSVDHGTAFDIAGTGKASTGSFIHALRLARLLAVHRTPPVSAPGASGN